MPVPRDSIRALLVQADIRWEKVDANLQHFESLLNRDPSSVDLIVLPEMFTTGFTMNAVQLAETMTGPTIRWMQSAASRRKAVVIGSFVAKDEGRFFNRLICAFPNGETTTYDKRHLFAYAGEDRVYSSGRNRLIFEWAGWRICPLVCYDLRFPVWSRNNEAYDLLVYIANFPAARKYAWHQLLVARAIENQSYVIGVNRSGQDGQQIGYDGGSVIVRYDGQLLHQLGREEEIRTCEIDRSEQIDFRRRFPFLQDGDAFEIRNE